MQSALYYMHKVGRRKKTVFVQENQVKYFIQAKSKWHPRNIYTHWRSYQAVLSVGGPWSYFIHCETLLNMWQGVNVILLVKSATHFFLSSTWDLKTECAVSVLIDMASLTQGFDSIMWAPWQSGGRWRNQAKKYHMYFPKAAQHSPNGSTWFNAISFHDLQVLKENYHIIAFQHAPISQNTAQGFSSLTQLSVVVLGKHFKSLCFFVFVYFRKNTFYIYI